MRFNVRNNVRFSVHESCAWSRILNRVLGDPSLYEEWTNLNRDKLPYTGYGRVRFPTAREYWTTGDERGMADFTHRDSLSKGASHYLRVEDTPGSTI